HHGIDLEPLDSPETLGPQCPPLRSALDPLQPLRPQWQLAEGAAVGGSAPGAGRETPVLGLGARSYVLFVGTVEPRKGIDVLLAAHTGLRRAGHPDLRLVIAGPPGWGAPPPVDGPGVVAPGRV